MLERQNDIDYGGAIKEKEREGIVISHVVAYFDLLLFLEQLVVKVSL
jgi:hypothetical protein